MVIARALLTRDDLYNFLKKHGDSRIKRELLAFLGRHHSTRFAIFAICHSMGYHKLDVEEALASLMNAGLVEENTSCGTVSYSLTINEEKRRMVMGLAALDREQWQLMVNQITAKNSGTYNAPIQ